LTPSGVAYYQIPALITAKAPGLYRIRFQARYFVGRSERLTQTFAHYIYKK
jgi:hypothetical protein